MMRKKRDESGAVMVATAVLVLFVLIPVTALAIDLGIGRMHRRQLQNAADAGALGGAQDLPGVAAAVSTAKNLAPRNAAGAFGNTNWNSCSSSPMTITIGSRTTTLLPVAGNNCIKIDPSFNIIRVETPKQSYDTLFARAIPFGGIDKLRTAASATAAIGRPGLGGILPFGLYADVGAGEACVGHPPTGLIPGSALCTGGSTGNYGPLDILQYGNAIAGTQMRCTGFQGLRWSNNLAIGVDHELTVYAGTPVDDFCVESGPNAGQSNAGPNTIQSDPGFDEAAFDTGLLSGDGSDLDDGGPARLRRVTNDISYMNTRNVARQQLDDTPLWEYIGDDSQLDADVGFVVRESCSRSVFASLNTADLVDAQYVLCFSAYMTAAASNTQIGPLFTRNTYTEPILDVLDIERSPRFGFLPRLEIVGNETSTSPPIGKRSLRILGFRAVYLQRLYAGCSGSTPCSVDYRPDFPDSGPGGSGRSAPRAKAITAIVFDSRMLPSDLASNPTSTTRPRLIQLVR